jgi:cell division protein FtsL
MKGRGTIRVALAFAALLASLGGVIWRQSRSLEVLRELDSMRRSRAALESERAQLTGRIQRLEGHARVREIAEQRFGLVVPAASDILVLKRPEGSAGRRSDLRGRVAMAGKD